MAAAQVTNASEGRAGSGRGSDVALYGVYEISKLLTAPGKLEVTLAKVLRLLSSFLDMRRGLIALLGENGDTEIVVGSGWSEATAKQYFDHLPERAIGRIVVTQMPLVVPDMSEDALFENWNFKEWGASDSGLAFVGVPIKDRGHVIGTLTIDREHGGEHHYRLDEDVRFLSMIANLVGQTVRLHRLVANDRERLIEAQHRLQKAVERAAPDSRTSRAAKPPDDDASRESIVVGSSPGIQGVLEKIRVVARSHSTVLLRGESGTGKELFARALHDLSLRKERPFVPVNCAALAESVLESELFGHEKGAFTGAAATRKGRFELADGGTLFLDEIGEISRSFQAKLLRVLQEGEFERVGGTTTLKVNIRLVAATNRNLEAAVASGDFRADLYYRICVVPIFLPPLRDRPEDIPALAKEFLRRFNLEHGTHKSFASTGLDVLTTCYFPGNVRELENCVRRTATLAAGVTLDAADFACSNDECMSALLWKEPRKSAPAGFLPLPIVRNRSIPPGPGGDHSEGAPSRPPESTPRESSCPGSGTCSVAPPGKNDGGERGRLIEAMEAAGWVQAKAARLLGITPRQISYALRKFEIAIKKF